jgi:ATP-dependent metalloprotease FtsH
MSNEQKQDNNPFDKLKDKMPKRNPKGGGFSFYWIYAIVVVVLLFTQVYNFTGNTTNKIDSRFLEEEILKNGDARKIVIINHTEAEIYLKEDRLLLDKYKDKKDGKFLFDKKNRLGPHFTYKILSEDFFLNTIKEKQGELPNEQRAVVESEERTDWTSWASTLIPIAIMVLIWIIIMRRMGGGGGGGGQIFNIGKSKAVLFDKDLNVNVTFNDVAGLEEAKVEIKEIVDFLKNPKKYTDLGAKIPKGALLVGPPGTGKTLLAKAVAGEAKVPFFSLSGSDFVEMFVGVGASRVRDLFRQAKEKAPCIIFIDEIDAIGRARGKNANAGSNDERENTLNQLLTEMDGFGNNSGIIMLAATNRADILDRALMRAGRFDRQIYVDMPDLNERKDIFKVHLKPLKLDNSIDIDLLSKQTPGFSGADIANICNEAALIAARNDKKQVSKQDFLEAVDRIVGGLEKKNRIITKDEREVIAYHEAGHAVVSWYLKYAAPLVKVTIVPRGRALGAAWYLPEERQITTTEQLMDEMCATLGGRAAEEITFGRISTGALNDLERITKTAYGMIVYYGLNEKVGNVSYYDSSGQSEYAFTKPYSEATAEVIDAEVKKTIEGAYIKTKALLLEHKEGLGKLAQLLLDKEVIFKEDMESIFGKRPYTSESAEEVQNAISIANAQKNGHTNSSSEVANTEITTGLGTPDIINNN